MAMLNESQFFPDNLAIRDTKECNMYCTEPILYLCSPNMRLAYMFITEARHETKISISHRNILISFENTLSVKTGALVSLQFEDALLDHFEKVFPEDLGAVRLLLEGHLEPLGHDPLDLLDDLGVAHVPGRVLLAEGVLLGHDDGGEEEGRVQPAAERVALVVRLQLAGEDCRFEHEETSQRCCQCICEMVRGV